MVVGAVNEPIRLHVPIDLSAATNCIIHWKHKEGSGSWNAAVEERDGGYCLTYVTQKANDIPVPGTWRVQGQVTIDGWTDRTRIVKFNVDGAL